MSWAEFQGTTPKAKTEKEKAKEEAHLSCIQLCKFNFKGRCQPKPGRRCNYAHDLSELQMPEESHSNWALARRESDNRPRLAFFEGEGLSVTSEHMARHFLHVCMALTHQVCSIAGFLHTFCGLRHGMLP